MIVFARHAGPCNHLAAARELRNAQKRIRIGGIGAGEVLLEICKPIAIRVAVGAIPAGSIKWIQAVETGLLLPVLISINLDRRRLSSLVCTALRAATTILAAL